MQPIKLPLLSSKGTPASSKELLDYLLAHALESDYSQTVYFGGKITSIAYIVKLYGNDPQRLRTSLAEALTTYLESFFQVPVVTISDMNIPGLNPEGSRYGIAITITAIDDTGARVNAAEGLLVNGSVMERVGKQT